MLGIKHSNELLSGKDAFDFYSSFEGFCKVMEVESTKIKQLLVICYDKSNFISCVMKIVKAGSSYMFDS